MSEPIKVRRYDWTPVDYLEGISDLDDGDEVAVYTVAFVTMQARGGPIENDAAWLARLAHLRTQTHARRVLDKLIAKRKLFVMDDGRLFQRRVASDLKKIVARIEESRINGHLGGRPPSRRDVFETSSRRLRDAFETSSSSPSDKQNQTLKKPGGLDSPINNLHSESLTTTTHLTPSGASPESVRAGVARLISQEWEPSPELVAKIRRGRPDLVGKFYDTRLQDFREWVSSKAVTTHNVEATFSSFMRNSKAAPKDSTSRRDEARAAIQRGKEKWGIK